MPTSHILGFPRIGARRELKAALEAFWRGECDEAALRATGAQLRLRHWQVQRDAGLDLVAAGDFAWYDSMLDTTVRVGALPRRFGIAAPTLAETFELARGNAAQPAMEMTSGSTRTTTTSFRSSSPAWPSALTEAPSCSRRCGRRRRSAAP